MGKLCCLIELLTFAFCHTVIIPDLAIITDAL
jgi:hypothetical protein